MGSSKSPVTAEDLNLRHLRAFCEVANHGSITAASEHVFLSQPAITQALAKLERSLGATLFVRRSDGMFLTEPGRLFENRATRALDRIRAGARRAARTGGRGRSAGFARFDRLLTSVQLRALLALSDTGNFSWAARNLGVSRPSVHRAAGDLERLSGLDLFIRTVQGFELTPAAQALERAARLAFAELRQGVAEINAWRGQDTAEIAIGSMPLARTQVLPQAINALARTRPEVRVRVVDGPYADLLHRLRHGRLDLLIGALRDPPPVDNVVEEELFRDALAVVARNGHPLAGRNNLALGDLAGCAWVTPGPGIPTRAQFDALFRDAGLDPPVPLVESSSLVLIRGLLTASDRLTLISVHQVRAEIEMGLLQRLPIDLPQTDRPIGLTVRRDWQPTATQSLLLDLLRDAGRVLSG